MRDHLFCSILSPRCGKDYLTDSQLLTNISMMEFTQPLPVRVFGVGTQYSSGRGAVLISYKTLRPLSFIQEALLLWIGREKKIHSHVRAGDTCSWFEALSVTGGTQPILLKWNAMLDWSTFIHIDSYSIGDRLPVAIDRLILRESERYAVTQYFNLAMLSRYECPWMPPCWIYTAGSEWSEKSSSLFRTWRFG